MFKKFKLIFPIIILISGLYADTTGVRLQRSVDGLLRYKIHNLHSTGVAGIWLIADTTDTARITIDVNGNLLLAPDTDVFIMPDGDIDDYISFTTGSNLPEMKAIGGANGTDAFKISTDDGHLLIAPADAIYLEPSGDSDDGVVISTSGNIANISGEGVEDLSLGGTSNELGNVYLGDNVFTQYGQEQDIQVGYDETTNNALEYKANVDGTALSFIWKADRGDDQGDEAKWNLADGGVLTYGSDIASAGSYVTHLTLTPHATLTTASLAFVGDVDVGDDLLMSNLGVINWNSDVTMTHSSDLLTITGGNTRVDELEVTDGTDLYTISVASDRLTFWNDAGTPVEIAAVDSTGKFFPGSEDDTYIHMQAADALSTVVGGVEAMRIIESGDDITVNFYLTVDDVTISDGGTGYDAGTLVFSGGGGSGAAGTYTVTGNVIDGITITNNGSGYTSAPTVAPSHAGNGDAVLATVARTVQLILPLGGSSAKPTLVLGGDNTGFYVPQSGKIFISTSGVYTYIIQIDKMRFGNKVSIMTEVPSSVNPVFVPTEDDEDTGIGWAGTGQLSLIAGAKEVTRFSEGNAYVSSITGHSVVETIEDASTTNGAATLTKAGENFDVTCSVGDAVLVYGGTTAADYGTYIVIEVTSATVLTVDRNFGGSNADVNFDVLADGIVIENATDVTNHMARLRVPENLYVVGTLDVGDITTGDITISDNDPILNYIDETGADDDINATIAVDLVTATSGAEDATVTIQHQVDGTMRDMLANIVEDDFTLTSYKGQIILKSANATALTLEADQDAVFAQDLDVVAALTAATLRTDTDVTVGATASDDVLPVFSIVSDADADGGVTVSETYSAVLVQHATPTSAFLQWSTTQSLVGMDFDMPITATSYNGLSVTASANTFNLARGSSSLDIAEGKSVNIDMDFTIDGTATTITGAGQANTITLNESFTIGGGSDVTITAEDVAGSILLDKQTFEVEGEQTATRLMKLVNANDAAATLIIEGTSAVVNQDITSDANVSFAKVITTEVEFAGNILLDPAVDGASYVDIANSGTGAAKLYIEGDQVNTDDLSDVTDIAMRNENETITGAWTFQGATDAAMALILEADASADNQDTWQILIADGDELAIQAYAGGSYADALTIVGSTLAADFPGDLTIATKYVYRADGTDVPDADVADNITITNISQVQDISASAAEINTPLNGASVTLTEFQELEAIDATTISANQWALLGGLAETLTSAELNILDGVTGVVAAEISYIGDVTGLIQAQLNAKAPLASPTFTGTMTPGVTEYFSVTVTLSAAQVNALRAAPQTVVAAQGANTWIELVSAVITYDFTATFTVAADEDFVIEYADGIDAIASIETTGFIDQGDDEIRYYPFVLTAGADPEASINQALRIFNTGAGETADGVDSEVDITVVYRVYTTGF